MNTWLVQFALAFPLLAAAAVPGQYIVEMAGDPVAEIRGEAMRQRRTRIQAAQRPVRARIEAAEAEILASVDTVANAFIVRIADEKASRLASLPGVVRVHPVRRFKLNLDHALPLHHVPEAWQQVGLGRAGAGMKIALIDTGIDFQHPGFQDSSLTVPSGFPRANNASDLAFTNNKVIVARSYADLWETPDPDRTPRDRIGHGTATGMAAAGVSNTGPLAAITGVAPKAWLGSYKVFGSPGSNDSATDASILKAIDDAVADGMDVINLSLGTVEATRIEDDLEVRALEKAAAMGVIVVVSAGNDGPDPNTIGSPGTAPSAITVGASKNDRVFAASATVAGGAPVLALPGSGANSPTPITAPLASVAALDQNGLACLPLPAASLQGRIAFILRGQCLFEQKLINAQNAGAVAALVYTAAPDEDPFTMGVGTATLPASLIGNAGGVAIQQQLAQTPSLTATLTFARGELMASADGLVSFSSKGPAVDLAVIKPDLVAVGTNFYTATQAFDRRGELFDPSGYTITQGTSFSSPLTAGAAAVLKAARPGLSGAQYRSLLINTAGAWSGSVQQTGAGILNLSAAIRSTLTAVPTALSFQVGDGNPNLSQTLTISNVGTAGGIFRIAVTPALGGPAPALSADTVSLAPGGSAQIAVNFNASALAPGQYEGTVRVADFSSGLEIHVPYWYAVRSNTPKNITVLNVEPATRSLDSAGDAILFRVTDASGIALTNIDPVVTVISGTAVVNAVNSRNSFVPGAFGISLRQVGRRGSNVVRIQVGDMIKEVTF